MWKLLADVVLLASAGTLTHSVSWMIFVVDWTAIVSLFLILKWFEINQLSFLSIYRFLKNLLWMFIKLSINRSTAARRRATDVINSAVIAIRRRGAVSVVGCHWGTLLLMLIPRIESTNSRISCWTMVGKFSSPNVMLISRRSRWRRRVVRSVVFAGKFNKSRSRTLVICQLFWDTL